MGYEGTPKSGWIEKASADNALATATHAAASGKRHYLTGVWAAYSTAPAGEKLLQLKDGTTVIFESYVKAAEQIPFPNPIEIARGNAVSAELAASGTAGVLGKVNITGFTDAG